MGTTMCGPTVVDHRLYVRGTIMESIMALLYVVRLIHESHHLLVFRLYEISTIL